MRREWRELLAAAAFFVAAALVVLFVPFPVHSQVTSITLSWTAPGDDGDVGTAASYQMRWGTTRPDTMSASAFLAWWNAATPVTALPLPLIAGTRQSATVSPAGGFTSGRSYYFVIRAIDDAGNVGDFSNVALRFVPDTLKPAPILDLGSP